MVPTTAEALELRRGIQTAIHRGITDVNFFFDAQVVVNCVTQIAQFILLTEIGIVMHIV